MEDESISDSDSSTPTVPRADGECLAAGDVLGERYKILRFIGRGGMGEVYEAEDLLVRQRVALKILRSGWLPDARAEDRFRRELQLARQVTHPNVCRVYDLGVHRAGGSGRHDLLFLTMEFLEGGTLSERIRANGPLSERMALPIVCQIADGLAAAHDRGVIHGDFKSGNVMLVRNSGGNDEPVRAVITDFGLARPIEQDLASRSFASSGAFAGTPEYMSPEQLQGGLLTQASDIYSLGVVLFEIVTGTVPFSGASPIATAVKSVVDKPASPRELAPELDPRWETAIIKCLNRQPEERFASAREIPVVLSGEPREERPKRRVAARTSLRTAALALAIVLVAAGSYAYWRKSARGVSTWRDAAGTSTTADRPGGVLRPAVAFIGFKNLSGSAEAAWLSTALSEMLASEISASPALRCIPGETISQLRRDKKIAEAESLAPATLAGIRAYCAADHVVAGSYLILGLGADADFRFDVRAQDASTGETVFVATRDGKQGTLLRAIAEVGADLRAALDAGEISEDRIRSLASSRLESLDATRHYAEGLGRLRTQDARAAREQLELAVKYEPEFPFTHLALSLTWEALGYPKNAADEAGKARHLAGKLSRPDQLAIEGRYGESANEWGRASQAYKILWEQFPDSIEHGLRLATAQIRGGREQEALATIESMRKLPAALSRDPRIDLLEASAAESLQDPSRQERAAQRAIEKAKALGAQTVQVDALIAHGEALRMLRRLAEAGRDFAEAQRTAVASGNRPGEVRAIIGDAIVCQEQGKLADAQKLFGAASLLYRELGDRRGEAWAASRKGVAHRLMDDLDAAAASFQEGLRIARETQNAAAQAAILDNLAVTAWLGGDRDLARRRTEEAVAACRVVADMRAECRTLGNYAVMLMLDGELATADRIVGDALSRAREAADEAAIADALLWKGEVSRLRGEIGAARAALDEAIAIARQRQSTELLASLLHASGLVYYESGDPAAARRCLEECRGESIKIGDRQGETKAEIGLASLDLDAADAAGAERHANAAVAKSDLTRPSNTRAGAFECKARVLLAKSDHAAGLEAAQDAVAALARGAPLETRLDVTITMARSLALGGSAGQALKMLQSARSEAERAGMVVAALEARLAEADLLKMLGRREESAAVLTEAGHSASANGLKRLAAACQKAARTEP